MSPVDESGIAKIIRDEDSFFRDHRGLLSMGHLIAFISVAVGVVFAAATIYGFLILREDWPTLGQFAVAVLFSGAGLEYGTDRIGGTRSPAPRPTPRP